MLIAWMAILLKHFSSCIFNLNVHVTVFKESILVTHPHALNLVDPLLKDTVVLLNAALDRLR